MSMSPSSSSYYDLLNVSKNASSEDISKAYKKAAFKWHPDRHMEDKEAAEEMFKKIGKAYEVLKDEQKRTHYNLFGEDNNLKGFRVDLFGKKIGSFSRKYFNIAFSISSYL